MFFVIAKRDPWAHFRIKNQYLIKLWSFKYKYWEINDEKKSAILLALVTKRNLLHTFLARKTAVWTSKGPCGSQKPQRSHSVNNGHNLCLTINEDRKTAIWHTLDTKGTLWQNNWPKKHYTQHCRYPKCKYWNPKESNSVQKDHKLCSLFNNDKKTAFWIKLSKQWSLL